MDTNTISDALVSPKPEEYGTANADANAVQASGDEESQPPTKKQKLIKAALLMALVLVIVYVILDYTVSEDVAGEAVAVYFHDLVEGCGIEANPPLFLSSRSR